MYVLGCLAGTFSECSLQEITTAEAELDYKAGLRPDMYKTLSMLTDTYVVPVPRRPSIVQVTYRRVVSSASSAPFERVKAMLRRLSEHVSQLFFYMHGRAHSGNRIACKPLYPGES